MAGPADCRVWCPVRRLARLGTTSLIGQMFSIRTYALYSSPNMNDSALPTLRGQHHGASKRCMAGYFRQSPYFGRPSYDGRFVVEPKIGEADDTTVP
jgi:hypothetical protein